MRRVKAINSSMRDADYRRRIAINIGEPREEDYDDYASYTDACEEYQAQVDKIYGELVDSMIDEMLGK